MPELRLQAAGKVGHDDVVGTDLGTARLDLRQVEDLVDEVQQVAAAVVDDARRLDLVRRQVAVAVVAQGARQDQQAVEGRAQLVRHVGEELGLVLVRQLQGLRLARQLAARLLDLGLLTLQQVVVAPQDLIGGLQLVLLRPDALFRVAQALHLRLQLGVGRAQLVLRLLQFRRLRLQLVVAGAQLLPLLLHQPLRRRHLQRRRGVAGGLLQVVRLHPGRRVQQADLDDAAHLSFEDQGQHADGPRHRVAEAGDDVNVVGRDLVDLDQRPLQGRLAHQAFAEGELVGQALATLIGIGPQQAQDRLPVGGVLGDVEGTDLRIQVGGHLADHGGRQLGRVGLAQDDLVQTLQPGLQPELLVRRGPGLPQGGLHAGDAGTDLAHLVAAAHRHLAAEVAGGDPIRGPHQAPGRVGHGAADGKGDPESAQQRREDEQAVAVDAVAVGLVRLQLRRCQGLLLQLRHCHGGLGGGKAAAPRGAAAPLESHVRLVGAGEVDDLAQVGDVALGVGPQLAHQRLGFGAGGNLGQQFQPRAYVDDDLGGSRRLGVTPGAIGLQEDVLLEGAQLLDVAVQAGAVLHRRHAAIDDGVEPVVELPQAAQAAADADDGQGCQPHEAEGQLAADAHVRQELHRRVSMVV